MAEVARAPQSLATRVIGAVLLLLIAGGVFVSLSTWLNGRAAAREAYDRVILGAANDIAESITIQNGAPFVDLPVSAFALLAQAPDDRIHYAVHGPDGLLITGLDTPVLVPEAGPRDTGPFYFDSRLQGEPARFVQVSRRFAERDFSGQVQVLVGQTLNARRAMAIALLLDAIVPMTIAGLALVVMAWFVVRGAVRPLDALADDLGRRDPYDLTPMSTERLPRELAVTVGAMNRFMRRLDHQFDAMRNMISDTAHQLRTPVAAIRAQTEAILDTDDLNDRRTTFDRLLGRTRLLGSLLDQLLSRALVIHRTDSAPRVPIDLRDVALDVVDRRDHELIAPGVPVRLDIGEDPVIVRADAFSLEQAAKNLLVNALKHGAAPVTVGVTAKGGEAALWVADAGTGPDPQIVERLGQRFERTAASREDSVGIGLSIVKAVAEAFDGRVELSTRDDGFRISLLFPEDRVEPAP